MTATKNNNVKWIMIRFIAFFLTLCFVLQGPLEQIGRVAAADKVYYISEVKAFQAENMEDAAKACEKEGYVCSRKDLNAGSGKDIVVTLGYKLTENRDEALYDISLLHMNGGYQIKDYAEMNAELEKSNHGTAEAMNAVASEFIINYNDGSPKAKEAYEGLNLISIPDKDNIKLGDYIIQGEADVDFFAKIITNASTGIINAINNLLTAGLTPLEKETDEKTGKEVDVTWASNIKNSNLWDVIESDDISQDELNEYDKEMGDDARSLFKQLQMFATGYENGQAVYNEEQYVKDLQGSDLKSVVEDTDQVTEEDNAIAYVNAYNTLNEYEAFDGMPLGKYLVNIGKQTSEEVDYRKLYPIIESMSYAQCKMTGLSGFMSIISNLGNNNTNKHLTDLIAEAKKNIKELMGDDSMSIWVNTDPELEDNRITMFVQREAGNVKPSAEITGGYNTALVAESKLYLNK